MPITIKPAIMKYKDANGNYIGVDVVAESTTAEQMSAIEAKGEEVIESIPSDYTELSDDVRDLKSAVGDITNYSDPISHIAIELEKGKYDTSGNAVADSSGQTWRTVNTYNVADLADKYIYVPTGYVLYINTYKGETQERKQWSGNTTNYIGDFTQIKWTIVKPVNGNWTVITEDEANVIVLSKKIAWNETLKSAENNVGIIDSALYGDVIPFIWERGTINTGTGQSQAGSTRIRTDYMDAVYYSKFAIDIAEDAKWTVFFYDDSKTYLASKSITSWQTADGTVDIPDGAYYFRMVIANTSNTDILPDFGVNIEVTATSKLRGMVAGDDVVPSYYRTQVDSVVANVRGDMMLAGGHGDSFVFISDVHWSGNYKHSPVLIKEIADRANVNLGVCCGDLIDRSLTSKASVIGVMVDYIQSMKKTGIPILNAIGNHERNSADVSDSDLYLSADQVFAISQNAVDMMPLNYADISGRVCYYYDKTATKTRYIVIDSGCDNIGTYDITEDEITWVESVIGGTETGWHILLFVHELGYYPSVVNPVSESNAFTYKSGATALLEALDTLKTSHNIEAVFAGHTHYDHDDATTGGIPIVWINSDAKWQYYGMTEPDDGTVNAQCFDVATIDYTTKKIYLRRIGRGSDRTITYGS